MRLVGIGVETDYGSGAPASTGKATVGPASNEFKAEARLCSGTSGVSLVPIDVGGEFVD